MARCANGHDSSTDDYCDVCGVPIAAGGGGASPAPAAARPPQSCGSCGQPLLDGARFCEQCGWDAEAATLGGDPTPPAGPAPAPGLVAAPGIAVPLPGRWSLVAAADRAYFDTVLAMEGADAPTLTFPVYWPERRFPLTGDRILIGRHSRSRGSAPEVDLGGQFTDPGVSHLHAALVGLPDGSWTLADLGSSNGTYLNDHPDPLEPHVPVPVREHDQIHVGAWTTLTLIPPTPAPPTPNPPTPNPHTQSP